MTMLTFAIGDIHGCSSKLLALLENCEQFADGKSNRYVFLGDYIDRGPDSRGVIELLVNDFRHFPSICLKGNHEAMLLAAFSGERWRVDLWLENGGDQMLESYGVHDFQGLSQKHIEWMSRRPIYHDDGMRFFVHAGVDPWRSLYDQEEKVMLWAREHQFSHWDRDVGRLVVHGHTPLSSRQPDLRRHRLNLDTGAVFGGPLTAAVFNDKQVCPIAFITDEGDITKL